MVAVPDATPVTTPLASMLAMDEFDDVHVPPDTVEVKVVVTLVQISWVPLNSPAVGGAATVRVAVVLTDPQPLTPGNVYVIVVDPAESPVTNPLVRSTTAILGSSVLQVPPVSPPTMERVVVSPLPQIDKVPVMVPIWFGVTVTSILVEETQPPEVTV
jgi:hypothetical protein